MDLEEYAKRALRRGNKNIKSGLADRILEIKDISTIQQIINRKCMTAYVGMQSFNT